VFDKVLILSASAGAGHLRAADAIEKAFAQAGAAREVRNIDVLDYTNELMSASDILLGKPGGLTTSEALAKGLAFVIVNPIPGQEERNSDHLLEEGVAIRCNNLPVLAYKVGQLLNDRERLARMQTNARRLGRPNAARDSVNRLLELRSR
jgi:processive 1,2-diacylglycerol beta-glucosyltransferase